MGTMLMGQLARALPFMIILVSCVPLAIAQPFDAEFGMTHSDPLGESGRQGERVVDPRARPVLPRSRWHKRQGDPFGATATSLALTRATTTTVSSVATHTTTSTSAITSTIDRPSTTLSTLPGPVSTSSLTASTDSGQNGPSTIDMAASSTTSTSTPLPAPFDTSLGNNFTSDACPNFFTSFLGNVTFKSCLPVSLLLQNSNSWFEASQSAAALNQILNRACDPSPSFLACSATMSSLASQLVDPSNCAADFKQQNSLVMQAHAGLIAYEPVYRATCVKSNTTNNYCLADAITNQDNPSDPYPYYSALGISLPAASRPTCGQCLQDTMRVFAGYAADKSQPLATTYMATAQQVDIGCGPRFANVSVPIATTGRATGAGTRRSASCLSVVFIGFISMLLSI